MDKGLLIVLSGPSGVGKGSVCSMLRQSDENMVYSVSATTRAPRHGEKDGINYFFKTREQFISLIENKELLEWAEYVGNYYGTPKDFVLQTLDQGKDVLLEIDVQGALKVKEKFPQGVFIFLIPPSLEELHSRINNRGTENIDSIRQRLSVAMEEMKLMEHYDYAVVNDRIEYACSRIQSIIVAEHCKQVKMSEYIKNWIVEV